MFYYVCATYIATGYRECQDDITPRVDKLAMEVADKFRMFQDNFRYICTRFEIASLLKLEQISFRHDQPVFRAKASQNFWLGD